ncbi:hypothetical protein J4E80_002786 [Alternaria sp. BMP 0032]|nr:hypothetical protein J4E80_002786 [Alternaria sp. BMP 0032]
MRFTIIAASLVAVAAAQYGAPAAEESCSAAVTVTVTETMQHTPVAPSMSSAYYPTTAPMAPSSAPVMGGTGVPMVPDASSVGTGYAMPTGTAAPTGSMTGPPPSEFTGAASGLKVGGALAGVGAVAAFFL